MNNSKAGCSQSKKKLQMNKDLLKTRLLYNSDSIYHPFFLPSFQIQSVIKSLNGKKTYKCSSHTSIKTPLCFDHFYLVSTIRMTSSSRDSYFKTPRVEIRQTYDLLSNIGLRV